MKNKYKLLLVSTMMLSVLFLAGCLPQMGVDIGPGADPPGGGKVVPNQFIVLFDGSPSKEMMEEVIRAAYGEVVSLLPQIGIAVAYSKDPGFAALVAAHPEVEAVGPDEKVFLDPPEEIEPILEPIDIEPMDVPGAPEWYDDAWLYHAFQWNIRRVGGAWDAAWHIQYGTHDVIVAILDTGVWSEHAAIAPNYIAHLRGYAVPGEEGRFSRSLIPEWADPDYYDDPRDFDDHGTHVAGIVAARGAGLGVGPGLAIANYRVLCVRVYDRWGFWGRRSWILAGIVAAVDDGVHVINMSIRGWAIMGEAGWLAYERAVNYAWENNVLIIAAAGNDEISHIALRPWISVPSGMARVVSVSATGPHDELAVYSDFGFGAVGIEITAPGGNIPEVFFDWWMFDYQIASPISGWERVGEWWGLKMGTSMSAPHVAGVAGLIIAQNPGIHVSTLRAILNNTAEDLNPQYYFGHGMVRADYAVER